MSSTISLMWNAVANNNIALVKTLIANKCDIERGHSTRGMFTSKYSTPLCKAVDDGNLDMVKLLLVGNADVLPLIHDHMPIHRAVRHGFFEIVKTLLKHKRGMLCNDQLSDRFTNDSHKPNIGNMALHFALSANTMDKKNSSVSRLKTVETLIRHGADVNVLDIDGYRPTEIVGRRIQDMNESIIQTNKQLNKMVGRDRISNITVIILEMRKELDHLHKIRELLI